MSREKFVLNAQAFELQAKREVFYGIRLCWHTVSALLLRAHQQPLLPLLPSMPDGKLQGG